ncbi:MAG: hypothetical protein WBA42_21375 [Mesorhizobium sp.]
MFTETEAAARLDGHMNGAKADRLKPVHAVAAWAALGADFMAYAGDIDSYLTRWDEDGCTMGEVMGHFARAAAAIDAAEEIMLDRA